MSPPYNLAVTSFLSALIVSLAMILEQTAACMGISNCCLGINSANFLTLLLQMNSAFSFASIELKESIGVPLTKISSFTKFPGSKSSI